MENKDIKQKNMLKTVKENKLAFFLYFITTLFLTIALLYLFNLIPEEFKTMIGREPEKTAEKGELPTYVKIPLVEVDTPVYNPASTSIDVLDAELKKGAVRYPGSGYLGAVGNVFLLGHSTSFKVVQNQAYKAFVGLKKLKTGDLVSVYSGSYEYIYKVLSVDMEEASKVRIDFDTQGKKLLTMVTCNTSIGVKEARYIVKAEYVEKKSITR